MRGEATCLPSTSRRRDSKTLEERTGVSRQSLPLLWAAGFLTPPQGHDTPAFAGLGLIGRIWPAVRYEFPNLIRPMDAAPLLGVSMATLYRMGPPVRHLTRNMAYIDAAWLDAHGADIPIMVSFDHAPTVRETARLLSCSTRQVHRLMACGRLAYAKTNARLALIDPESLARLTGRTARSRRYAC